LKAKRPVYLLSPTFKKGTLSLPMIQFNTIADRLELGECDTLMFTSKQAVITAEAIDPNWKNIASVAVGPATKKQIEALGGEVIFYPENFYGEKLAGNIADFFQDRNILYLRPKEITFDSKGYLLKRGITLHEQIIYETSCINYKPEDQPPESSVIVFTSPSTIHCFLNNFQWLPSYTAVVIGQSTQQHLPLNASYVVADTPLIDACIKKAKELF
jgi:uroporphyrinogen-III synthase